MNPHTSKLFDFTSNRISRLAAFVLAALLGSTLSPALRASFEFQTSPQPNYYALSSEEALLIGFALIIETNGPVAWTGGSLSITAGANWVAAKDHIGIRRSGFGATELSWESTGGALNIKYGGVTFATAGGFLPGTNLTSGDTLICTFNAAATGPAVQALLFNVIMKRDGFGYGIYETNVLATFPAVEFSVALTDAYAFTGNLPREVLFPTFTGLRCVPPVLYSVAGAAERTGELTTFADFDSGAQLARIRPQLTYEIDMPGVVIHEGTAPHSVYFESTSTFTGPIAVRVSVSGASHADFAQAKTHYYKEVCWISTPINFCIMHFMGEIDDECGAYAVSSFSGSEPRLKSSALAKSISLPSFRALESLMKLTSEGNRLNNLYRQHSKEVGRIVTINQSLIPQCQNLFIDWQPFVSQFLAGNGTNVITPAMINSLNSVWSQLITHAGPTLKTNLLSERARFNNFQDFTNKTFIQWAQMLAIPSPTNRYVVLSEATPTTNGHYTAQANYAPGANYSLVRSFTLSNWSQVTTLQLQTNTSFSIRLTDTNPPSSNTFYRALVQ